MTELYFEKVRAYVPKIKKKYFRIQFDNVEFLFIFINHQHYKRMFTILIE